MTSVCTPIATAARPSITTSFAPPTGAVIDDTSPASTATTAISSVSNARSVPMRTRAPSRWASTMPSITPSANASMERAGRQAAPRSGSPRAMPNSTMLPVWFAGKTPNRRVKPTAST